ncbi:MAG TPA: PAS domain S-box protein [Gemmataceae bacterium]|jgi:PAS domain S-box-containing protein|nr:PAS domain S-box protein [Gemmataceae bacterium]
MITERPRSYGHLLAENESLRRRLEEAEQTVEAIHNGEVHAVVVSWPPGDAVYTLEGADQPYRLLVEQMPQGAATLTVKGAILYCNRRFADLLGLPVHSVLGKFIGEFVPPDSWTHFESLLRDGQAGDVQREVALQRADGMPVPVYLGVNALFEGARGLCLVVTDLTEQEARKKAERFADRMARLQEVTAALSEALTVDQVAEVIVTRGMAALDASVAVVALLTEDGSEFVNLRVMGYASEVAEGWTRFPADAPRPMADAVRMGQPIVVNTLAERNARYPELASLKAIAGDGALAAFPLLAYGRAVGALRLDFPTSRAIGAEDLAYIQTLAQQCAQALERARPHDAERRAREKAEQEIEQRTQAEESLRRSERDLADFFENAAIGLHWVGPDGSILRANQAELDLLGYPREEYVGHHIAEFHADAEVISDILRQLQAGETLRDYAARLRCKDGSIKDVLIDSSVLWEEGRFIHTRCFTRDITERKRAGEALRESETRLRNLVFALPAAVYTTDREGRITLFNDEAAQLWGRRPEIGKDLWCGSWRIFRPDGTPLPHEECPMAVALREGSSVQGQEIVVERPDGMRVCVLPYPVPLRDSAGEIVGGVNMLVDITDRKRAEEARSRLAAIVESSDDAIIANSLDGTITSWNKGAERIFGYSAEEIVGRPITTLAVPDSSDAPLGILERMRQGERIEHYQTRGRTKDGRNIFVSLAVSPVRDAAGRIIGVSKIARDITEQKRLEEALQDQTRQLAEADRRKDDFLAMLGHELRNPLGLIRNAVEIHRLSGHVDPVLQHSRDMIDRQAAHMARLIDDLLDVSRIAHGKVLLRKEVLDLVKVVEATVEDYRGGLEAAGLTLKLQLPDEPLWVRGDPTRLAQIVGNVLHNASKFTEPSGCVTVRVAQPDSGNTAVIAVRDTGIGMDRETLIQVFETFRQAENSQPRSRGGLGLGLALVKGLVELHDGSVQAESEGPGRGSEITIRLPMERVPARSKPGGRGPTPGERTYRILLIEDNRDAAESIKTLLGLVGHRVETAYTGATGVEAARAFHPQAVLCDIGLPGGMDGYAVARALRPEFPSAHLIALTGYGREEDQRRAYEAGFDQHMTKPVDFDKLQGVLASLPVRFCAAGACDKHSPTVQLGRSLWR